METKGGEIEIGHPCDGNESDLDRASDFADEMPRRDRPPGPRWLLAGRRELVPGTIKPGTIKPGTIKHGRARRAAMANDQPTGSR